MSHIVHFQGNLSPSLLIPVEIDGEPVDEVTSAKFRMRLSTSSELKVDADATEAQDGLWRHDWLAGHVDEPGFYVGWLRCILPGDKPQDTDPFVIEMRPHAMLLGALTTLDQVREYLQKPEDDRDQDTVIQRLILCASKAIMEEAEREFAPAVDEVTRQLVYRPNPKRLLRLGRFDLRAATEVTLHPESDSPVVLEEGRDFVLEPFEPKDGVYRKIRFARSLPVCSSHFNEFGTARLAVEGNWGFPTVPEDVQHWTKVTVWTWMRRDVAAVSTTFSIDEARLERPEALPSAVRSGIRKGYGGPGFA